MLGNSIGWVIYGTLTSDPYCFASSGPGVVLSCWLNLAAVKLIYQEYARKRFRAYISGKNCKLLKKQWQSFSISTTESTSSEIDLSSLDNTISSQENGTLLEQFLSISLDHTFEHAKLENSPLAHDILVVGIVAFWTFMIAILTFISMSHERRIFFVGLLVNINLVLFYVGPLSTMYTIILTSDSSSIHRPTMIVNTLSSIIWAGYGIGRKDLFMSVPNIIGAALGFLQLALCALYPLKKKNHFSVKEDQYQSHELKEYGACAKVVAPCAPPIEKVDQLCLA
jgi:solute carrier family 50 protein (sugar transporter)